MLGAGLVVSYARSFLICSRAPLSYIVECASHVTSSAERLHAIYLDKNRGPGKVSLKKIASNAVYFRQPSSSFEF